MAESAVKSSIDWLGKILLEEGKYLWGAEGKVEELLDELLWMQSFLREADVIQYKDEVVRVWVSQIKQHVSEAEDIIEDFVVKVASLRRQKGLVNKFKRCSCILKELYDLHQVASKIDSLKVKISTLSPKLEKYGLKRSSDVHVNLAQESVIEQVQQSLTYAHMEGKKIVGLEKSARRIIEMLKSNMPTANNTGGCHAIYGMGGLGKTTLATKVYQNDEIKRHFSGGQAFAYVSKQFHVETVLQKILTDLSSNSTKNYSKNELVTELCKVLKKNRCLVVLDDVWTEQAWDSLKSALHVCGGKNVGSKVLITTRKREVAKYIDEMALRQPDPLNEHESWELLLTVLGWEQSRQSSKNGNSWTISSEKMKLGKEMVKVCKGLPLAIVVLGGILRKKQSWNEWDSVCKNINSHLIVGHDHGRSCMEILLQSYDDLPYHLKLCFLHLANFPQDCNIDAENVYWMWVGEGLVTRSCTKSPEDVANDYLNDLAQVGLVEITDTTPEGRIGCIRMHDLVADVCLEKATTDNFVNVIDLHPGPVNQVDTSNYYGRNRLLRMGIHLPTEGVNKSILECLSSKAHKHLRSLLLITDHRYSGGGDVQKWMKCICKEFRLLRVLFLKNIDLGGRLTSQVENLNHLRYLSLAGTLVSELPHSIGNLRFLEILDLRVLNSITLKIPNTMWRLFRMRHLLLPDDYKIKRSKRLRVDTLICLEAIENVVVSKLRSKDLMKLKSLKRLSIRDIVSEEILEILLRSPALQSSVGRCSLGVNGDVISKKPVILSGIACNHQLRINGPISVDVSNVEFSQYLQVLTLTSCQLEDDPMGILGSLSLLKSLTLNKESYVGKKMSCDSKSFPLLAQLIISCLNNLEVWELEHGGMPKLERLSIWRCNNLYMMPDVLPSSLNTLTGRNFDGAKRGGGGGGGVDPYGGFGKLLEDAVLKGGYHKVIFSGKAGVRKATNAMELCSKEDVKREFEVLVKTGFPRRRSCNGSAGGGLPRRVLQRLLRDLNPNLNRKELSQMSCDNLIAGIRRAMQQNKCLVILFNLEDEVEHMQALDNTFGLQGFGGKGSKLVITSESHNVSASTAASSDDQLLLVFKMRLPTNLETWQMLPTEKLGYDKGYWGTNAGIKWNMLRHCSGHPLSTEMLLRLLKRTENFTEWVAKVEKLTKPAELSHIFELCYNELPPHLRPCLVYLANFPEDVEISAKTLYQMWIAAGFVRLKQDHVQTQESLENLACSYLTELVQRGMVTVVKQGPKERAKACQVKFALRDLCLQKAKEQHILTLVDNFGQHTKSTSNAHLTTQQLAIYLDQVSSIHTSLEEQLNSLNLISSPTSLLFFSNVSDPTHNEAKWDWLLYICKHFQLLRVLHLQEMWMTKGKLPKEVADLGQLRYLSLRGTWVDELPPSIENLRNLQTLDLRVMESIVIPDVLCKLTCLMHLYLPCHFNPQGSVKLRFVGLTCLQTLVNLHTDKVYLTDLFELKLLRKVSINKIHTLDEVNQLDSILKVLSTALYISIDGEIINANPTILSMFKNLQRVKIKGKISAELHPQMFPTNLEELTLKHTKLKKDPLLVLGELLQLRRLFLDHQSFFGHKITVSKAFHERATLTLCSLSSLKELRLPIHIWDKSDRIVIIDCWRLTKKYLSTGVSDNTSDAQYKVSSQPRCCDMSLLKKFPQWSQSARF